MNKFIFSLLTVVFVVTGLSGMVYGAPAETGMVGDYHDVELPYPSSLETDLPPLKGTPPTSYSSRTSLPTIRNQGQYGTCWAFSSMASAEAEMISKSRAINGKTATGSNTDLSEYQLAHFFYNSVDDPLGNTGYDMTIGMDDGQALTGLSYLNRGGNMKFSTWSMAAWKAGAAEGTAPYTSITSTGGYLDDEVAFDDIAHLQNAYWIYLGDTTRVKDMIMEYGGVSFAYYSDDYYYSADNKSYFQKNTTSTNHAVFIVGWDDNYSKSNFNSACRPTNNGAWLVRNSWGSNWGDGGYFWISYEDTSIVGTDGWGYVFQFESADNYDYNYQYDGSCGRQYYTVGINGSVANRFDVYGTEYQELDAVSLGLYAENVNYSIQIYLNPQAGNPTSGYPLLSTPQTGKTTYVGYHTIPLKETVILAPESSFSVVFTFPNGASCFADTTYDNGDWIRFISDTSPNQSFLKGAASSSWFDLDKNGDCVRIKAFTNEISEPTATSEKPLIKANATTWDDGVMGIYAGTSLISTRRFSSPWYMTLDTERVTWNGTSSLPKVTSVTDWDDNIIPASEYTVTYPNLGFGYNEAVVTFKSTSAKYQGMLTANFELIENTSKRTTVVTKADASTGMNGKTAITNGGIEVSATAIAVPNKIELEGISFNYTGKAIKPTVKAVYDKSNGKVAASNYTVSYSSNPIAVGTYQVTVTFAGSKYMGKLVTSYTIKNATTDKVKSLQGSTTGTTTIKLTWKKQTGASGYHIYRYDSKSKKYQKIKTITKGTTVSYTDKKLKAGTTYKYKICSYKSKSSNTGPLSGIVTVCTKPSKVTSLKVAQNQRTSQKLSWKAVSGADGYEVYDYSLKKGEFVKVKTITNGKKTTYTINKREPGGVYWYQVRAYKKAGGRTVYGAYSNELRAYTKD